jgi:hypothetical protein
MNFPSPEAAAWLHMLGILEQSAPQGLSKRGSSVDGQSTFPSIYQPLSHDNLDETVMS